jgi:probable F420-dependent oxidoreductase
VGGQYDATTLAYDPIVLAAVACQATRRIQIGHLVLCNLFRHPVMTAQSLVSLDRLSGGRAIAGLGTGWTETEFRMTGLPFPDVSTRLEMLDEALTCMRSLWTNERTTFEGRHYRFRDAILWPKPVRKPYPPILLGGSGRGLLRLAAKHADVVNVIAEVGRAGAITVDEIRRLTDEQWRSKIRFVRDEAARNGRDPRSIRVSNVAFTVMLTGSTAETRKAAENLGSFFGGGPEAVQQSPLVLVGTPEEMAKEIRRRKTEWGIDQLVFSGGAEAIMRRLAEEVLPAV